MPSPEDITKTVNRYLELLAAARADDVVELYAEDATVEDPVGSEVHIGHQAIRGFYTSIENIKARTEVETVRALGQETAFHWRLTLDSANSGMRIDIISVMTFNDDGKIASMKAYWSPDNVTQLSRPSSRR